MSFGPGSDVDFFAAGAAVRSSGFVVSPGSGDFLAEMDLVTVSTIPVIVCAKPESSSKAPDSPSSTGANASSRVAVISATGLETLFEAGFEVGPGAALGAASAVALLVGRAGRPGAMWSSWDWGLLVCSRHPCWATYR